MVSPHSAAADALGSGAGDLDPAAAADVALARFRSELAECLKSLQLADDRAVELQRGRAEGVGWAELASAEEQPLIVERISAALDTLLGVGGQWRHREALALHADGMSINRIAALFKITRQRASTLIKPRPLDESP
jgi:hypothetical protein